MLQETFWVFKNNHMHEGLQVLHQVCICTAPQAQPGPVPSSSEPPQAPQYKLFSSNHLVMLTVLYVFGQTAPTTLWHIRAYTKHYLGVLFPISFFICCRVTSRFQQEVQCCGIRASVPHTRREGA